MTRFFRLATDGHETHLDLEQICGGPTPAACWIIGGGPSLNRMPCDDIACSPVPKFAVNLAGHRRLRPNFWTAYDPSVRFQKSIYLDAGITKFLPRSRAMDLIPETTFKVCESPQSLFFDRDPHREYHNLLDPQTPGIVDWADSLLQAIDIAYRLGFRELYFAGCDLAVDPGRELLSNAQRHGVTWIEGEPLAEFTRRSREAGLSGEEQRRIGLGAQYHFDEEKSFEAAIQTDGHYFRVVQSLRLCRSTFAAAGLRLISVTPRSRLNAFFSYQPVEAALDQFRLTIGDPDREPTRGLYTQTAARPTPTAVLKDVLPPRRKSSARKPPCPCQKVKPSPPLTGDPELIVEGEAWTPLLAGEFVSHDVTPDEYA